MYGTNYLKVIVRTTENTVNRAIEEKKKPKKIADIVIFVPLTRGF